MAQLENHDLVQAICWKMGLPIECDDNLARDEWNKFRALPDSIERLDHLCNFLSKELLGQVFRYRLGLLTDTGPAQEQFLNKTAKVLENWLATDKVSLKSIAFGIDSVLKARLSTSPKTRPSRVISPHNASTTNMSSSRPSQPSNKPNVGTPQPPADAAIASHPTEAAAAWKNLPPPVDEPDPHTEYDERSGRSPEGCSIIGARARGKKHKHEGTHCDDWFHFDSSGPWTVLAVSDGGGSYKFSRVGAKAASQTAIQCLNERLSTHKIKERADWNSESFEEPDVGFVKDCLVESFAAAWNAVKKAAEERLESEEHRRILGRPLTVKDLYCTLLVAAHTTVRFKDVDCSFVLACSVGDGMISAIDKNGATRLLMTPDSGEHSGEVRFLEEREIEHTKLRAKIYPFLGSLRALLLMTDGVADDYFPNDPGMSVLYGDLVLNNVLPASASDEEIQAALSTTKIKSVEALSQASLAEIPGANASQQVRLRSMSAFTEALGLPVLEVVKNPALLAAGTRGEPFSQEKASESRLRVWLDSYQVRGSFDDRTLLALHR